jgi:hypothetical protein
VVVVAEGGGGEVVVVEGTVVVVEVVGAVDDVPPISNQSLRRPKSAANWSPDKETEPSSPTTSIWSARPPNCPRPLRSVTSTSSRVPIELKVDSMSLTGTSTVQECTGLAGTESPRSRTAGNGPPAV